jgi:serine/threonine protein kinase/tetratricopeptide (TPR) repeat protein
MSAPGDLRPDTERTPLAGSDARRPAGPAAGDRVGPYKLLEPIGEGGMGEVWAAEQADPIRRRVALKLIKPGMDSRGVLARFEAERQALALMDHPNIAKVFDAGTAPDGRPYFAMELVKGVPITKFCDDHKFTPRRRLELFVPVCQALQHAHQKGVIHRDVKPSNVLVELHDDKPIPKVIDFGVAKALGQPLTEKTIYTGFGTVVGTPAYMAPEQATFNALDVDTRADVYSLGVLLYELLTGSPPFDPARLKKAALDEVLRVIREEEPPTPRARLAAADTLPAVAARRGVEPARLVKLLRGDLEWVVMKCLEKDRARRYETASGLAADVQRYLAEEPVTAGPPSGWYRARKFLRRNRGPAVAVALVLLTLVGGVVGTTVGLVQARRERAEAERQRDRAAEALDSLTDTMIGGSLSARREFGPQERAFLARVADLYAAAVGPDDTPAAARRSAGRHLRLARLRYFLGQPAEALTAARRAVELGERAVAADPADRGAVLELADACAECGELGLRAGAKDGEPRSRRGLQLLEGLRAADPADRDLRLKLCRQHEDLSVALRHSLRPGDADAELAAAEELIRSLCDELPEDREYRLVRARLLTRRANNMPKGTPADEVIAAYRAAAAGFERIPLAGRADRVLFDQASCYFGFAFYLSDARRPGPAVEYHGKAADLFARLAAAFPAVPQYRVLMAQALRHRGDLRLGQSDPRGGEDLAKAAALLDGLRAQFPDVRQVAYELAEVAHSLSAAAETAGRRDEALDWATRATAAADSIPPETTEGLQADRWVVYKVHWGRAAVLERLGRGAEAAPEWDRALASAPANHVAAVRANLAVARARAGRHAEAIDMAEDALRQGSANDNLPYSAACVFALASADPAADPDTRRRRADRALSLLRESAAGYLTSPHTVGQMLKDPDLAPVRDTAEFRRLAAELADRLPRTPEPAPPPRPTM